VTMATMAAAGLGQPRGANEQSEHGQDHQSSPPHRVQTSPKFPWRIWLTKLTLCRRYPLFHRMGERLALFRDQYGQNLERGRVAGIFRLVHVGGLLRR
jgi:hypothetical protein